jgi:cytochrome c-type biogenesis protein CcmE
MKDEAYNKRLRVAGDVEGGSIQRVGSEVRFVLTQDANTHLKVAYYGTDPLPDTFKDGAQALADGKLDKDGVFRANKIQAKCASKYEAKPGQFKPGEAAPNINTGNKRT